MEVVTINALVILILSLCVFTLACRFYGAFLAAKVLVLRPALTTLAHRLKDGRYYLPANKFVLFGHHSAAIAGAVHDYVILFASVRHDGKPLHKIARDYIGKNTGNATEAVNNAAPVKRRSFEGGYKWIICII
jgi:carbon starvation protein